MDYFDTVRASGASAADDVELTDAIVAGPLAALSMSAGLRGSVLTHIADRYVIDVAIDKAQRRERRDRSLPAWMVVYTVLALCLFAGEGYASVLRQIWPSLSRGRRRMSPIPHASSLSKARTRLGPAPLHTVFDEVSGVMAGPGTPGAFAFGLRIVSIDGTVLDVPDSADNDAVFDRYAGGVGRAVFPQVRLTMLIECATHAVIAARFDGVQIPEQLMADELFTHLQPGMLLLADRNFFSFQRWKDATASGAHLLWRIKAGHGKGGGPTLPVLEILPDGSYLSRIKETTAARAVREKRAGGEFLDYHPHITVRIVEFTISITDTHGNTRQQKYRLATTVCDPDQATAADIAALYTQRWESETAFGHLKTRLRGPRTILRSHHPDTVRQEIWAYLCLYQALCRIATTAAISINTDPDHISFTVTLRELRRTIIRDTANEPGKDRTTAMTTAILDQLLPTRRHRVSLRTPKPGTRTPRTQQVTHKITIEPP